MAHFQGQFIEFASGVWVNLVAEYVSHKVRSLCSDDTPTECKESLANSINLARAITHRFSKAQFTIENEFVIKYHSDLIVAADEGERVLRSSTSDTKALKRALSKLENLTSNANTYMMLFEWEKNAAESAALEMPQVAAPRHTCDNPNPHPLFDMYKSEEEDTLNSPAAMYMISSRLKQFCRVSKISKMITGRISKNHRRFIKNMKALTSSGGFICNGDHSINNLMKMKGKCPEYEFDEQTGYGDASMPAISCFPSSSRGGVGYHINPSSRSDVTPDEHNECVGDVLKSFDGIPE